MRTAALVFLALLPVCLLAQGQGDRPVFRGGVDLVQIDVSVLDGKRQPVRGLTAADFTVLENGVSRPIRAFAQVELPARPLETDAAWINAVQPDVATNQVGAESGRLVIILMDRTIPVGEPTVTARRTAMAAIDALGPQDVAAVVSTSGGMPQTLTSDKDRLRRAIAQRDWSTGVSAEADEVLAAGVGPQDALQDGRCLCGLCVLDTITRLANAVRDTPGRAKVLLFIGSSVIVQVGTRDPKADVGCDRLVRDSRNAMFDSLALSHLTVHSFDPRGLFSVGPQTRASTPNSFSESTGEAVRRQLQQGETNALLSSQGTLQVLPDRTGGRAILNTNTPETKVPDVFGESGTYYVLGFESGAVADRGSSRVLDVKVNRKGARAFTQRRYMPPVARTAGAAASGSAPSLDDALGSLLPAAGTPLDLAVAAFADADDESAVVHVSVGATGFLRDGTASVPLDVAVATVDQAGRPVASVRQTSTLNVPPATTDHPRVADVHTHLTLGPGDYEVRVAIADRDTGAVASVFKQIVVPPFATAPLSLSDVAVETTGGGPATRVPAMTEIAPTTRREFTRGDHVAAFLQVYQGTRRTDPLLPVPVRARILDAHGGVVQDQTLTLAVMDFRDRRADCRIVLPVDRLAPGSYLLQLDATMAGRPATRMVRFDIR